MYWFLPSIRGAKRRREGGRPAASFEHVHEARVRGLGAGQAEEEGTADAVHLRRQTAVRPVSRPVGALALPRTSRPTLALETSLGKALGDVSHESGTDKFGPRLALVCCAKAQIL